MIFNYVIPKTSSNLPEYVVHVYVPKTSSNLPQWYLIMLYMYLKDLQTFLNIFYYGPLW